MRRPTEAEVLKVRLNYIVNRQGRRILITHANRENWRKYLIDFTMLPMSIFPGYGWGNRIRGWLLGYACKATGTNLRVAQLVKIYAPQKLTLGANVYLGHNCYIGNGTIDIGDEAVIGAQVVLSGADHVREGGSVRWAESNDKGLRIGRGVWIGARSVILSGIQIGDGVVVAAGSVVTKSIRENVLVAGVPAVEIKELKDV